MQRFIQAVMELVDRKQYISWSLPEDWHILLSSNPDNGEYIVNSVDDAQATRFLSMNIKYNEKIWAEWAENNHIDSRCINFMLMNPEAVEGVADTEGKKATRKGANPRQWVNFFYAIGNLKNYQEPEALTKIETIGQMAVGEDLTASFIQFIHNNMDKLIEPEFMLLHKDQEQVIKGIEDCIHVEGIYRNDIASILAIRFSNWTTKYLNQNSSNPFIVDRIHDIITKEVFGADLAFTIAKLIYAKNRSKLLALISKKSFMQYTLNTNK